MGGAIIESLINFLTNNNMLPVFTLDDWLIYHSLENGAWTVVRGRSRLSAPHDDLPALLVAMGLDVDKLINNQKEHQT